MFSTLFTWLEDEAFLIKSLTPTLTSISCNTARSSQQDSILRLLLNTIDLQPKLLGLMLEKLAEISLMQEGQEMMNTQQGNIPSRPPEVDLVPAIPMAPLNVPANQRKNSDFWEKNYTIL